MICKCSFCGKEFKGEDALKKCLEHENNELSNEAWSCNKPIIHEFTIEQKFDGDGNKEYVLQKGNSGIIGDRVAHILDFCKINNPDKLVGKKMKITTIVTMED